MTRTNLRTSIVLSAVLAAVGCGKDEKSTTDKLLEGQGDVDLVADLTGIDENTHVAPEKDDSEQPGAPMQEQAAASEANDDTVIGGNQGAFIGIMKLGEKEVNGTFNVLKADATGETVIKGAKAGKEIRLDPGKYDFVFTTPSASRNSPSGMWKSKPVVV